MARLTHLIIVLLLLSASSALLPFMPPEAVLQVGYPAGFRAFIPDFPGCERFGFHGKLNSPFEGDEAGSWAGDVLRPFDSFWTFEDTNTVLSPGDVLHYWTLVVKDKVPFLRKNLTWTVPSDPNDAVDFVTPTSATKGPKPTAMKMMDPDDVTEDPTHDSADGESLPSLSEVVATVRELAENSSRHAQTFTPEASTVPSVKDEEPFPVTPDATEKTETTPDAMSSSSTIPNSTSLEETTPGDTSSPESTTSQSQTSPTATSTSARTKDAKMQAVTTDGIPQDVGVTSTEAPKTMPPVKPTTKTEKLKTAKPKKSTSAMSNPLVAEDVEELTTPAFEKPLATEFPQEPSLFPFPSLFPNPFKPQVPMLPPGPGFDICSNPWSLQEQPGESRTQRLEKQVARLQCELAMFQRGTTQLGNTVENELNDLKKLIYGMVSRMTRLETLLRSGAFG